MIRTILIDDEKDSLSALSHVLTEMCPEVSVVDSCQIPALGIESILKHKPDLVFLDVEMPKINGFELLEEVKHQARLSFSPRLIRITQLEPLNTAPLIISSSL
ncbi:MAG: response regulator [Saprospiraceae bacterium]|nr:response regulator [Saprospiraceae bacterium]